VEEEIVASGIMPEWLSRDSSELMPIRLEIHYYDIKKPLILAVFCFLS
jgi:hypothetical protein